MITKIKRLFEIENEERSKKALADQMKLIDSAYIQGSQSERAQTIKLINKLIDKNDNIQMYNYTAKEVLNELNKRG